MEFFTLHNVCKGVFHESMPPPRAALQVCATNRAKELLAQGLALRQERTPEQEK